jgi:erythronate-4-phosphate dehydrogenase
MVNSDFLKRMKPGAIFFNSSRGSVHETRALLDAKRSGKLAALFLDVWEGEPRIDAELLAATDLASPHICGYSADGKVAGVVMVQRAACELLEVKSAWDPSHHLPAPPHPTLTVDRKGTHREDVLRELALKTYDIREDDARMRCLLDMSEAERAKHFDRLRKEYPVRREFWSVTVDLSPGLEDMEPMLAGVGFSVA